ncbi:MAG TPA: transcription elongation factor GreA, partial [Gammaproteobacteria bacterium]|nr:transcription elongation factor GreA [Gammaproteobacteria bacterium]
MERVLLTAAGAERLRKELKHLKAVERPRVIAD